MSLPVFGYLHREAKKENFFLFIRNCLLNLLWFYLFVFSFGWPWHWNKETLGCGHIQETPRALPFVKMLDWLVRCSPPSHPWSWRTWLWILVPLVHHYSSQEDTTLSTLKTCLMMLLNGYQCYAVFILLFDDLFIYLLFESILILFLRYVWPMLVIEVLRTCAIHTLDMVPMIIHRDVDSWFLPMIIHRGCFNIY